MKRFKVRHSLSCTLLVMGQLMAAPLLAQPLPGESQRAAAVPAHPGAAIALPAGLRYPNGIAVASDGAIFTGFVSSGVILRQQPGREWETFFPGSADIYAATSLRLDAERNLLWGTSPDFLVEGRAPRRNRLFALDASTARVRHQIELPEGSFANDIALELDGSVLITDSLLGQVLRWAPGAGRFDVEIAHAGLAPPPGGIGVSGIARAADGRLLLANFGTGSLWVAERHEAVRQMQLPRLLANPDGLALAADGALIVCEGDIEGGNGRVLRIVDPFASGERTLQVLADGLESPVNLSVAARDSVLVTEARIRHRLVSAGSVPAPDAFRILRLRLGAVEAE